MIDQRIKVFVSSTQKELRTEREVARNAISSNPSCAPVMFEDFGARAEGPREAYITKVRESNIIVGILWKELSKAVEEELIESLRFGKDLLVFVKDHDEEEDADRLLQRLKESSAIVYVHFADNDDLKEKIGRSLGNLIADRFAPKESLRALDFDGLFERCRAQVKKEISNLTGEKVASSNRKYIRDLYANRKRIERDIARFLNDSDYRIHAVVGQAGVGKTNLACNISESKLELGIPSLFFNSATIGTSAEQTIVDAFDAIIPRSTSFMDLQSRLEDILSSKHLYLLVVFDAVNEAPNPSEFRATLTSLAGKLSRCIKVVITCRDIDWGYFSSENDQLNQALYSHASEQDSGILGSFTNDEFDEAWSAYKKLFDLKGNPSDQIRDVCRHPLLLRFLAEGYAHDLVPVDVKRRQIFDRYWDRKLNQTRMADLARDRLFKIVHLMIESGRSELPLAQVVSHLNESAETPSSPLQKILSEGLIIYVRLDTYYDRMVGFSYEAFFEYVIAKYYWQDKWAMMNPAQRVVAFKALIEDAVRSRPIRGALEFLILFAEKPKERLHLDMLETLIGTQSDLEIVASSSISKLEYIDDKALDCLKKLSQSDFVDSAMFVRDIFVQVHYRIDDLDGVLETWASDEREFVRGAVSATLSRLERAKLESTLDFCGGMLADQSPWIRMNAINSLAEIIEEHPEEVVDTLRDWSTDNLMADESVLRAIGHVATYKLNVRYLDVIETIYNHRTPKLDCYVALALSAAGHTNVERALDILESTADSADPETVYESVVALKNLGEKSPERTILILAKAKVADSRFRMTHHHLAYRIRGVIDSVEHQIEYLQRRRKN